MRSDRWSLAPREHGAYAMLAYPLLSGLLIGGGTAAGLGVAVVAVTLFLAHEPLAIVLGQRGVRLRERMARAALWWVAGLAGLCFIAAAVAVGAGPPGRLTTALWPGVPGALVAGLTLAGRTKTIVGELLVAAAFALLHVPVAAMGGGEGGAVVGPASVWVAGFVLTTLAVHSLKHRFKGRGPNGWTVPGTRALAVLALAVAASAAWTGSGVPRWALAFLPMGIAVFVLSVAPVHPRHLVRIGWTIVAMESLALVGMVLLV